MTKISESGALNALLLPFIIVLALLIGAASFAFATYSKEQDYKNNSDQKVNAAVASTQQADQLKQSQAITEALKNPFRTFSGPSDYGSLQVQYPASWSAYVDESTGGSTDVDGYFYPGFVPAISDNSNAYALRVQIVNQSYSSILQQLTSGNSSGTPIKISPYALPRLSSVVGTRVDGPVGPNTKNGSMVILPLRDKTVQIWTEDTKFQTDFENILKTVTFSP
jgi:hypothetical protein